MNDLIAVIPARKNSKGLPNKNKLELNGIPLIFYSINTALESEVIEHVIISTDDREIQQLIRDNYSTEKITIDDRPSCLAEDDTNITEVLEFLIKKYELTEKFKYLLLLQPTSPIRELKDIVDAYHKLIFSGKSSCVSVIKNDDIPEWSFYSKKDILQFICKEENFPYRRQDAKKTYKLNGSLYFIEITSFSSTRKLFSNNNTLLFEMNSKNQVDIDDLSDFKKAENLIRMNQKWKK